MARSALLNVMVTAASKAGRSLTRDFRSVSDLQVSLKGPGDFVSQADMRAEEIIHAELSKARPGWSFLMEERGLVEGDEDHRWIVDPLDGTLNFLHSIPLFAVSIGLEVRGQLQGGVIYNPITEELFTAERGAGAFLNDRRLRVSARKRMSEAVVATGMPSIARRNNAHLLAVQAKLMGEVAGVRAIGSAALALAWTAAGRFDASYDQGISAWDVAAGLLILREAGGFATAPGAKESIYESGRICAGNEPLQKRLRELVREAKVPGKE